MSFELFIEIEALIATDYEFINIKFWANSMKVSDNL